MNYIKDAQGNPVKDSEGNPIDIDAVKKLMNYHETNFEALKEASEIQIDMGKLLSSFALTTSSDYGHAWSYIQEDSDTINCYCYSLNAPFRMNPGDGDGVSDVSSQKTLDSYFKDVNVMANAVIADGEITQLYFKGSMTGTTYSKWRILSSKTASVSSEEHRIALRVGFHDYNDNGHVDMYNGEADYHFMVQTSTGTWAEKHGEEPSINVGYIDRSTYSWDLGSTKGFYNSSTVYLAVRV